MSKTFQYYVIGQINERDIVVVDPIDERVGTLQAAVQFDTVDEAKQTHTLCTKYFNHSHTDEDRVLRITVTAEEVCALNDDGQPVCE